VKGGRLAEPEKGKKNYRKEKTKTNQKVKGEFKNQKRIHGREKGSARWGLILTTLRSLGNLRKGRLRKSLPPRNSYDGPSREKNLEGKRNGLLVRN